MSSLSDRSTPSVGPVMGLAGQGSSPSAPSAAKDLAAALAVTRAMFGGEPEVEAMSDPENPDHEWIDVSVVYGGTRRERLDLQLAWHDRIEAVIPDHLGRFTLSIIPADEAG